MAKQAKWKPSTELPATCIPCPTCAGSGMIDRAPLATDHRYRRKRTDKETRAVLRLVSLGWSVRRIAAIYPGMSKSAVQRIKQRYTEP